jgi:hypothetical protein
MVGLVVRRLSKRGGAEVSLGGVALSDDGARRGGRLSQPLEVIGNLLKIS